MNSLTANPKTTNALLVDSESATAPVPADKAQDALIRVGHLRQRQATGTRGQGDGWTLSDTLAVRVHLMVQCMEAWIVADPDALAEFYKQEFKKDSLPKRMNLEEEPKADVYAKLESATENTHKGKYGKIKHASKLLEKIRPDRVGGRCPRFGIFRDWLNQSIDNPPTAA
jgi:hypothetical protein